MKTMSTIRWVLPIGLVACASVPDESNTSTNTHAITSTKWLSCWVRLDTQPDPDFRLHSVECSAGIDPNSPVPLVDAAVDVEEKTTGSHHTKLLKTAEPTVLARLKPSAFPVTLNVTLGLARSELHGVELSGGLRASLELSVDKTIDKPLTFEQPFDIWPVEIGVHSAVFHATFTRYELPLAPFKLGTAETPSVPVELRIPPRSSGKIYKFFLAVPKGTRKLPGLAGFARDTLAKLRIELDGPGQYLSDGVLLHRVPASDGTTEQSLEAEACPPEWADDQVCDSCLANDPDCGVNGIAGCQAQWRGDGFCDACLGDDPDCGAQACPASWRGDGVCDACLGNDPDCGTASCPDYYRDDGICDVCLGNDPDCATPGCPASWRGDGVCDSCLGDDPDCTTDATCPASWYGDGVCDSCLGDDPDCAAPNSCPASWYGDGICDACLGDDPDCAPNSCPIEWYGDGYCDACLGDDPDCDATCPIEWYGDGICDECLGDDPDCL